MHRFSRNTAPEPSVSEAPFDWAERGTVPKKTIDPDRKLMKNARVPLRVLLVEDSALLVQRISELVNALPFVRLEGNVNSEAAALERLDAGGIDAIILDLQLHAGSGFGVLKALHKRGVRPRVIVFTNFAIARLSRQCPGTWCGPLPRQVTRLRPAPSVLQEMSETAH